MKNKTPLSQAEYEEELARRLATLLLGAWRRLETKPPAADDATPAPAPHDGAILTIDEVAARLRVERRVVRQLISAGEIKFKRVGERNFRFKPSWVDAYLEGSGKR